MAAFGMTSPSMMRRGASASRAASSCHAHFGMMSCAFNTSSAHIALILDAALLASIIICALLICALLAVVSILVLVSVLVSILVLAILLILGNSHMPSARIPV